MLGDGEIQEGQVWEAALFAQARKIDNLIAFIDYNGQQIDGTIEDVMNLKNLRQKWEAFNWIVLECNGNNMQELISTIKKAQELSGKEQPIMILSKTEMGHGVDFMTGSHKWHGVPPSDEQLENALSQLEETLGDY